MTDDPASKSLATATPARVSSWRDDARRSLGARFGAMADAARERRWPIVVAAAIIALSGVGVVAKVGGGTSERAETAEKSAAEAERRVAELGAERKRREDQLAELQKRLNAKQSELAEAEERAEALDKRRTTLERQVAELVAPVAAHEPERVADRPHDVAASSDTPPDETADDGAAASVESDERTERGERVRTAARTEGAAAPGVGQSAAPVRVFIHVRAADPAARDRAAAVAAELRRRGVTFVEIRGVRLPVRQDMVRFFYDEDRGAVPELQDAVRSVSPRGAGPAAQDLRSFGAPPRRGTVELWLS